MTLQQAYEILKKIQDKTATKEEQALKQKAFQTVSSSVQSALKGV